MSKKNIDDSPDTAREFIAWLNADPEYRERKRKHKQARAARHQQVQLNAQPVLEDLRKVGFDLYSLWDLVNTSEVYEKALPVLLMHLRHSYMEKNREAIYRALTVPYGRGLVASHLMDAFEWEDDEWQRWVIGNALSVTATKADADRVAGLLREPKYGDGRDMLVRTLRRVAKPEHAREVLSELVDDPDIGEEAQRVLVQVNRRIEKAKARAEAKAKKAKGKK